ncbi:VirK/YbjX family protein [Photobacterium alginatilyticum]|uniref:VirK/YbjX family protein n=1 Tax=Photobacterium alginatilyticum TaxID=1775171 RepID=UPI004067E0DB
MNIVSAAVMSYPDDPKMVKHVSKFLLRGLVYYPYLTRLMKSFTGPYKEMLFSKQPDFLTKCMRPYLHRGLKKIDVVNMLIAHHNWVKHIFSEDKLCLIYKDGIILDELTLGDNNYYMVLSYEGRYWKEGELTLRLSDNKGTNYYVLSFTVFENNAYIGGVQGPDIDDGFSRLATKELFGLRPKSLMLETVRVVLQSLEVSRIFGVKNRSHTYTSLRYLSKKVYFDYDTYWEEHSGISYNKDLYEIPLYAERRNIEELNRTKRKMYRKRYAWLDSYQQIIQLALIN